MVVQMRYFRLKRASGMTSHVGLVFHPKALRLPYFGYFGVANSQMSMCMVIRILVKA